MTLKDTVNLMTSDDYKDRLKAEYFQLKVRLEGLRSMIDKWDSGMLDFTPAGPRGLYDGQMRAMRWYLSTLESRADFEGVDLKGEHDNG